MHRQHLTRRIVLSAAVVGLAVLAVLGSGDQVNAEIKTDTNNGSRAAFKSSCESTVLDGVPGAFVDSPKDGLTSCVYGDRSKNTCDQQGNNCTYTPPQKAPSSAEPVLNSISGLDFTDVPPIDDDPQVVAPDYVPLEAIAETPGGAVVKAPVDPSVDNQVAAAVESGALAVPAEEPVTLTEEPLATEASVDQP
jgi:hypothetical protein